MQLREVLPDLFSELVRAATTANRPALFSQLAALEILGRCGCDDPACASLLVEPQGDSADGLAGQCGESSITLPRVRGNVTLDLDADGRVTYVEILQRSDLATTLDRGAVPRGWRREHMRSMR